MRQRARKAEDKQERRGAILEVALEAFEAGSFADVKMSEVAERAGLAKGTVFLYFPTKEALFLALLEERLAGWFDAFGRELSQGQTAWTAKHAAEVVASTVVAHEPLARLLTLLHVILELNVERESVQRFKAMLLERVSHAGALLEARLPFLAGGEGGQFLLHLHALVIGLRQMADNGGVVKEVLDEPRMAPLRVDFARELEAVVERMLVGAEAKSARG
ncbi:MAG TPA: TetR family transcriptional regulator [Myxococcaceae bacterium]|nr:TetR family transcriptional regulator [Myxococcaceae bacterium]